MEDTTNNDGNTTPTPNGYYKHLNQHKFTVELEFLSSLASPTYLKNLSDQGLLNDAAFIRYIAHLVTIWSTPSYVRFLRYPMALTFARAICQSPTFRQAVGTDGWENEITHEMIAAWAGKTDQTPSMLREHKQMSEEQQNEISTITTNNNNKIGEAIPTIKQEG